MDIIDHKLGKGPAVHLGDGAYAVFANGRIGILANHHMQPTDTVVLDSVAMDNLIRFYNEVNLMVAQQSKDHTKEPESLVGKVGFRLDWKHTTGDQCWFKVTKVDGDILHIIQDSEHAHPSGDVILRKDMDFTRVRGK